MIYWLRRSSPILLAQNDPQIRVLMKYPGWAAPVVNWLPCEMNRLGVPGYAAQKTPRKKLEPLCLERVA
jgi:hypothetical protein